MARPVADTRWEDPDFDDEGNVDVEWYPVPAGLHAAWDALSGESDAPDEEKVEKARARKPKNSFGHRDRLRPGMTLRLRKNDIRDRDSIVAVLPDGHFGWNGHEYQNGNRLLKAITGKERHRLTIRRYFGLGGESTEGLIKSLRAALANKAIVVNLPGEVYISGRLDGVVPPEFTTTPQTAHLSKAEAQRLLDVLNEADNG